MKLSKFPVTSDKQEYLAVVKDKKDFFDQKYMQCKLYIENNNKTLFHPFKFNQVMIAKRFDKYEVYKKNIKALVKDTVSYYERELQKEIDKKDAALDAIKEFEEWDGVIGD